MENAILPLKLVSILNTREHWSKRAGRAIRDGIADYFLTDDRNPQIEWQYGQEKAKDYGVRIDVVSKPQTA